LKTELLFYKRIVRLDPSVHDKLRISPAADFSFAGSSNSVPIILQEFAESAKEYPIAFAKAADSQFVPVAVLGLADGENLFVDASGLWDARYVPAFVRRYPFVPAESNEDKQLIVCFDDSCPRFNQLDGEPLLIAGQPSAYLGQIIGFLREYHASSITTADFAETLNRLGILVERRADAVSPAGERYSLSGLWVVDETELQKLDMEQVERLFRSGELAYIYLHLASLSNFTSLLQRKAAKTAESRH